MTLHELPPPLYDSLMKAQADITVPRIYAIGAKGYMVDLNELKIWYEKRMANAAQ
jgi:hypothetical protein